MKLRTAKKHINNFIRSNSRVIRLGKSGQHHVPDKYLDYTHNYNKVWKEAQTNRKIKRLLNSRVEEFRRAKESIIEALLDA